MSREPTFYRGVGMPGKDPVAPWSYLHALVRSGRCALLEGRIYMSKPLALALALYTVAFSPAACAQVEGGALKRIKDTRTINLGYRDHAAPFSFRGTDGKAAGYSVDL